MRRTQRILILLLFAILVVNLLPTTAQAEEASEQRFILVAEGKTDLIIAPEYITYTSGQTIGAALEASKHTFTGLDMGQVTAINAVTGSYTRSDQNGGYDLSTPASSVTHYRFSTYREDSDGTISEGLRLLMTAMADYLEKEEDVRMAAKPQYLQAKKLFTTANSQDARTLATKLNKAISDYERTLVGTKYTVSFTDGSTPYSGASITAVNAYGKQWEDEEKGDGVLQLPEGLYTFRVSRDGLSFSGQINVKADMTISADLPTQPWLKQDTFRLSGSYGEDTDEESRFTDEQFTLGEWSGRNVTVPVVDSFAGAVYTYAEYDKDLLSELPVLTAVYTAKNATADPMEKDIPFESLKSGAYSVLAKGAEGNTVIYRLSSLGAHGYTYAQDYTVRFKRIPTLKSITVVGTEQDRTVVDQAATEAFDGNVTEYTYKVLNTIQSVTVSAEPLVEGYTITVNGQKAEKGVKVDISGNTVITVVVSANGYSNTYTLNIQPGEGRTLSFISDNGVTIEVVNSNGMIMPYTTKKHTAQKNRYKYTLVPGEQYSYVATNNTYYHIADDFHLEEVANSIIEVDFTDMEDWLTELAFGAGGKYGKFKNTLPLNKEFTGADHFYQVPFVDTEHLAYVWVTGAEEELDIQAIYNQVFATNLYHGKEERISLTSGLTEGVPLTHFLMDENPVENRVTIRLTK